MSKIGVGDQHTTVALQNAKRFNAAAATNGAVTDLKGYKGLMKFQLSTAGSAGNADNTLNVKLQTGDKNDGSDMADVANGAFPANASGAGPAATPQESDLTFVAENLGRYVRAVITVAGTTPDYSVAVLAVGYKQG